MKIMDWIAGIAGYATKRTPTALQLYRKARTGRGFNAADSGDRFADWVTGPSGPNEFIRPTLKRLRARSRDLAINNDYMQKYLKMVSNNVIGPTGVKMQMKIEDSPGVLDRIANQKIESAWNEWSRVSNASVTGDLSFLDMEKLAVQTVARDGELLIRKIKGFDNPFKFALQFIEADHLNEDHHNVLANGNKIRSGIEFDQWGSPVAYHLLTVHPGDSDQTQTRQRVTRVPADEIIHLFMKQRPGQVRGVPWAHSSMVRLKMIGGYEEAELTGARASASKMGFFERGAEGGEYQGDDKDADGNMVSEFAPGTMETLPLGVTFKPFDPGNPSSNFKDFMKTMLRGAASGLNVAYNTLANDLEGVNFSSIRSGVLEERENWRAAQRWVIQHFHEELFGDWLTMALLSGQVNLPMAKFNKFNRADWQARGWSWVDPKKDVESNVIAINNKLKSHTEIVAEQGKDLEDVLNQIKADEELAAQIGVDLNAVVETTETEEPKEEEDKDEN